MDVSTRSLLGIKSSRMGVITNISTNGKAGNGNQSKNQRTSEECVSDSSDVTVQLTDGESITGTHYTYYYTYYTILYYTPYTQYTPYTLYTIYTIQSIVRVYRSRRVEVQ